MTDEKNFQLLSSYTFFCKCWILAKASALRFQLHKSVPGKPQKLLLIILTISGAHIYFVHDLQIFSILTRKLIGQIDHFRTKRRYDL